MAKGKIILRFYRREVLESVRRAYADATKALAAEMERAIKASVSQSYPPASKPGRLPHKRTGNFLRGIRVQGGKTLTIRSAMLYGSYLETGTRNMDARPWAQRQFQGSLGRKWANRFKILLKGKLRGRRRR